MMELEFEFHAAKVRGNSVPRVTQITDELSKIEESHRASWASELLVPTQSPTQSEACSAKANAFVDDPLHFRSLLICFSVALGNS